MDSGEKFIDNVKDKLKELAIEELFYAVVNPSQAAIMKYGLTPPVPKEAANLMKEIFVVKEKLLTEKDVKIVEKAVKIRKDVEHGIKKSVSGKELGELLSDAEKYLKKIKEIYNEIEIKKDLELIVKIYDDALTILRNILIQEDVKKISETEILSVFEEKVIKTGKLPNVVLRDLKVLFNAYNDYEKGKLKKLDISKIKNKANATMRGLIEYLQSMNFKKIEDAKVRFEYGKEMVGEIYLIDDNYYVLKSVSEDNSFLVFDKKYKFLKEIEKEEFNEIKLNGKIHKIKLKKELLSVIEKELKTPICIVV
jgi:uncharacterized protein (UPF0332 family)